MSTFVSKIQPKLRHNPPSMVGHWLLGVMPMLQDNPVTAFETIFAAHGDAVRFKSFANFWGYLFVHPAHNKHILQDNNTNYTKMPSPGIGVLRPLVGNGLLTSDGDFWRRQRRLAQPAFHRRRIASFADTMAHTTAAMLTRWHDGQQLDIDHEMMELTLEIVGRTLFSIDITREADTIGEAFSFVSEQISYISTIPFGDQLMKFNGWPLARRVNQQIGVLDKVVAQIIDERRRIPADQMPDDLLTMLMQAVDEETGTGMDDQQLRDEVMTILLAGHETTANTLTWAFYLLAAHPEVRAKLDVELRDVLNGRLPTFTDIPNLPYTKMVVEETMRLYPPAYSIPRFGHAPDKIGGYDTPANAIIILSPYLTHRHPDFWENPTQFDPERFTAERSANRPRYAYIPFGGGPRQCIGNSFAMTEAILILAAVAQQYQLTLKPDHQVDTDPMITLRPKGGMPMQITAVPQPTPA